MLSTENAIDEIVTNATAATITKAKGGNNAVQNSSGSQMLYASLAVADPEVHALIEKEKERQFNGLELIASEVYQNMLFL